MRKVSPLLHVFVVEEGVFARHQQGDAQRTELVRGGHSRYGAALSKFPIGQLGLDVAAEKAAKALLITTDDVKGMLHPELAWRYDTTGIPDGDVLKVIRGLLDDFKRPELIWLAGRADAEIPLQPLMHVLAGALAQGRPQTAIVELGSQVEAARWSTDEKRFVPLPPKTLKRKVSASDLGDLVGGGRGQILLLNPKDPMSKPDRIKDVKFDRIIYVTDQIPTTMPPSLRDILRDETFGTWDVQREEPYFVSFVPTVPVPLRNPPAGQKRKDFRTCKVIDSFVVDPNGARATGLRPHRDACVVPIDRKALSGAWDKWVGGPQANRQSFLDAAVEAGAIASESAARWARGVTMRRVGIALSGGGASAYRVLPILWRLHRKGVPVDVFAGLSGGALMGAFYCAKGLDGLRQIADLGAFIQLTMPLAVWSTLPLEAVVDRILGFARVENLEVRFAAVTVALPADKPPRGEVVDTGTLGEAARVSGALPAAFAPTEKRGTRYSDGGACTVVPARIARDHGADVILSCNAIPGPAQSNPFHGWPGGDLLRRLPPWDRFIDFDAWRSYMWQQTSRRFGDEADAFIEFKGSPLSALEPMQWILSWRIVAEANKEGKEIDKRIQMLEDAWKRLEGTPSDS